MADITISELERLKKQYSIEPEAEQKNTSGNFNAFDDKGSNVKGSIEKILLALEIQRLTSLYKQSCEDHNETLQCLEDLTLSLREFKDQQRMIKLPSTEERDEKVIVDRNSVEMMFENINKEALLANFGEQTKSSELTSGIMFLLSIEIDRLTMINKELTTQMLELEKTSSHHEEGNPLSSDRHSVIYRHIEELENKVVTLEEVRKENEDLIVSLDGDLRSTKKELEHLKEEKERVDSLVTMLANKEQNTREERDELASSLADLRMKFSDLTQKHANLQQEFDMIKGELEDIRPLPNFPSSPLHHEKQNLVNSQVYSEAEYIPEENSKSEFNPMRDSLKLITESGFLEDKSRLGVEPNADSRIANLEQELALKKEEMGKLAKMLEVNVSKAEKSNSSSRVATMINKSILARSFLQGPADKSTVGTDAIEMDKPVMVDRSAVANNEAHEREASAHLERQLSSQALSLDNMSKNILDLQDALVQKDTELEAMMDELSKASQAMEENTKIIQELRSAVDLQKKTTQVFKSATESKGIQTLEANNLKIMEEEVGILRKKALQLETLEDQITVLKTMNSDTLKEMESWKFETEVLKQTIQELESSLKGKEKEVNSLRQKISEFKERMASEQIAKKEELMNLNTKIADLESKLNRQESNNKFNEMLLNQSEILNESQRSKSNGKFKVGVNESENHVSSSLSIIQYNNTILSPSGIADANTMIEKHAAIVKEISKNLNRLKLPPTASRCERLENSLRDALSNAAKYKLKYEALLKNQVNVFSDSKTQDSIYQALYEEEKKSVKFLLEEKKKLERNNQQKDQFIDNIMAKSLKFYEDIENAFKIKELFEAKKTEIFDLSSLKEGVKRRNTIQGYIKKTSDREIPLSAGLKPRRSLKSEVPEELLIEKPLNRKTTELPPRRAARSSNQSRTNLHDDFLLM